MLARAVGGLERDAAVGQRAADLDDVAAVAREHALERGQRAVDVAEIADLGHALELGGGHVAHEGEDAGHGDVDPDVDRAQLALDPLRGGLHPVGIGHVAGDDDRLAAQRFDVALRALQRLHPAGDEADVRALGFREHAGGGATDAGGGAGDDDDSWLGGCFHEEVSLCSQAGTVSRVRNQR